MKNFKNMLVIAALFAIGSVSAKRTAGYTGGTPAQPEITPIITPGRTKPLTSAAGKEIKQFNSQIAQELKKITDSFITFSNSINNSIQQSRVLSNTDKADLLDRVSKMYSNLQRSAAQYQNDFNQEANRLMQQPQEEEMSEDEMRMRRG